MIFSHLPIQTTILQLCEVQFYKQNTMLVYFSFPDGIQWCTRSASDVLVLLLLMALRWCVDCSSLDVLLSVFLRASRRCKRCSSLSIGCAGSDVPDGTLWSTCTESDVLLLFQMMAFSCCSFLSIGCARVDVSDGSLVV